MTNQKLKSLLLVTFSIWWGWTILTDFFVVPSVFRIVPDFFVAGELGMTLFKKLNLLEMIVAILVVSLSAISPRSKILLVITSLLMAIAITYFFYLTPKMQTLTEWWKEAEGLGITSIHGIDDIQLEHQKYHRFYVWIDAVKLLLLTSGLSFLIFKHDLKNA